MKAKHIILFLLLIMLLMSTAVSCMPKDDTLTSDLGVSRNNIVETDGWAYYINADGLHKIRPNGKDKTLVLDIRSIFLVYEDRVYYIPYEESDNTYVPYGEEGGTVFSIYSCKTDGSDKKFICEIPRALPSEGEMQMRVVDGWIYLGLSRGSNKSSYDLYRMSIDGTGMTMISATDDMIFDYSIDDDGWIYYIKAGEYEGRVSGQLWSMRHDGTENQQVMQEVSWAIDYNQNEIFYIDMSENYFCGDIYAVSWDGSEKRKVAECEAESSHSFLKVIGNWVYYLDIGDNPGFYKVRTDGSDCTRIPVKTPPKGRGLLVIDNWLMYSDLDIGEDNTPITFTQRVRISDMYDTDDLYDQITEDQKESALRKLNTDYLYDQRLSEIYEDYEVRKYE